MLFVDWNRHEVETVFSIRPAVLGVLTKTPWGGGDVEIQKAFLMYNVVTSTLYFRHN